VAPAEAQLPEARTTKELDFMATHRILRQGLRDEAKRTVLREAQARYLHELMDSDERLEVWERIVRLRRQLGLR